MRHLTTISLALAITLSSAGSTVSQELENPRIQRCKSGLERSVQVCVNLHDVGSTNLDKCLDYSVSMYQICVKEALEHMATLEG